MVVIYRPDKQQPVAADQRGRNRQHQHFLRLTHYGFHARPAAADGDQQQHKQRRPDDAMRHDLARCHLLDQFEIGWRNAPDKIGAQREKNTLARLLCVHHVLSD